MKEEYVVRVGECFISKSATATRLLTCSIRDARRFPMREAFGIILTVKEVFYESKVFVARATHPDEEVHDPEWPFEFVVCIGRRFLSGITKGEMRLVYRPDNAQRFAKWRCREVSSLIRQIVPDCRAYAAHEDMPYCPLDLELTCDSPDEIETDEHDDSNEE